ncbi:hypothetical protein [Streptococcus suis]|uniref:hypothetical protein n=1 Tax=Streptococcus suis TaxID=1307 RepID=UPI0021BC1193|nr:hypothetical protein [Streptococcus suis]
MHHDTWKGIILQKQGLLKPLSVQQICQNLNGLQAQFQPYVHVGFRNRMTRSYDPRGTQVPLPIRENDTGRREAGL